MRRSLVLVCGVLLALAIPASANATITTVFNDAAAPLSCTVQATTNYRFCGTTTNTTIPSFDGSPIDVSVSFPADAGGSDNNFPLVGMYHGWGQSKTVPSNADGSSTRRWLDQGYAVISITDRGWGFSCGGNSSGAKAPPCTNGYIHLMSNTSEVRDAQYLMGMLADDGVINGQKIVATGGSYGGAISAQLAALNNRTQLPNNTLVPWLSPVDSHPMSIAAALPEYTWSDLPQALMPNGSGLDYAADTPYKGPNGDHRVGVDKRSWNTTLYNAGLVLGYLAPTSGAGFPDPTANLSAWFPMISTGGPYDGNANTNAMITELENNHSAYSINSSVAPAPMLLSSGWNDDLFPVSEAVRMYNKVRKDNPTTAVNIYGMDYGHSPRSNDPSHDGAALGADFVGLKAAQDAWVNYYVKSQGPGPATPLGGVTVTTSKCTGTTRAPGVTTTAASWAELETGEVEVAGSAAQTISPDTAPATPFTSGTVCSNSASAANTSGAAVYESPVAAGGGYTLAGSPSVDATLTVNGANDQIISRLYDVDTTGGPETEKLIARGVYRPMSVGAGATKQTFQLYPQAWKVEDGHKLKLELLSADSPYVRTAANTVQQPITVSGLTLHVPTLNNPGDASGAVGPIQPRTLPTGYAFTSDALGTDKTKPSSTDDVTTTLTGTPPRVTLTGTDVGISGVSKIYYTTGAAPATPTTSSSVYDPNNKPVLQDGEKIKYFAEDYSGNVEVAHESLAAAVDTTAPNAPTLITGPPASSQATSASVTFAVGAYETSTCSIDGGSPASCTSPYSVSGLAVGTHIIRVYAVDSVGNVSAPLAASFTVLAPPKLSISGKEKGKIKIGKTIGMTVSSKSEGLKISGVTYSYKWLAGKKTVGKKSKLKLTKSMKGKKISVVITAKKTGFTTSSKTVTISKKLK